MNDDVNGPRRRLAAGALDQSYLAWQYLNGSQQAPPNGLSAAAFQFAAPSVPGTYELRFFSNNSYTKLATSAPLSVSQPSTLSISEATVTEGWIGTKVANFTVTLTPADPARTVTVNYFTADGSATGGGDYVQQSGALTFSPSETTRTVSVAVNGDFAPEQTETYFVNLLQPVNAVIGIGQGTGTIVDDDVPALVASPSAVSPT